MSVTSQVAIHDPVPVDRCQAAVTRVAGAAEGNAFVVGRVFETVHMYRANGDRCLANMHYAADGGLIDPEEYAGGDTGRPLYVLVSFSVSAHHFAGQEAVIEHHRALVRDFTRWLDEDEFGTAWSSTLEREPWDRYPEPENRP